MLAYLYARVHNAAILLACMTNVELRLA